MKKKVRSQEESNKSVYPDTTAGVLLKALCHKRHVQINRSHMVAVPGGLTITLPEDDESDWVEHAANELERLTVKVALALTSSDSELHAPEYNLRTRLYLEARCFRVLCTTQSHSGCAHCKDR